MYKLELKHNGEIAILKFDTYEDMYKSKISFENCQMYSDVNTKG